jgi:hypothetical protein
MPNPALRSLLTLSLSAILLLSAGAAHAAACDKCPERSIALYDFNVTAPRPDSLAEMAVWYSLFYAAPGAGSAIFTAQCARFIDASFYRDASGVPSNSLKVGIDQPNTAPAGNLKGMDYLVTGTVAPEGSGFQLTMSLECACNRKKVLTATRSFASADQASAAAAELANGKFVPIADVIREYEREARAGDPDVSIGGYNATLTVDPIKRKAALNEKVSVTLTLMDCDGEPLAGRTISLTGGGDKAAPPSSNGAFTAAEAVTGADGKVTVEFQVGSKKGAAMARAYFFHKTPFGCEAVAVDEGAIEVDGSAGYYQVRYEYEETHDMTTTYEERFTPTWLKTSRKTDFRNLHLKGAAVFKNTANAFGGDNVELEGAGIDDGIAVGSYREAIHFTANENYSDDKSSIRSANYEDRITEGSAYRTETERPDFFVSLVSDDLEGSSQFSFTIPFELKGKVTGNGYQIITASGMVFDTVTSVDENETSETVFGPSVKILNRYSLKDSAFHIDGFLDTSWSVNGTDTELRGKFTATVAPIAWREKPNAVFPKTIGSARPERIRLLGNGSAIALRLQDIAPETRVRVCRYSLRGDVLAVLYDAPRGAATEINLPIGSGKGNPGEALSVLVFSAGTIRESRVLTKAH